MSAQMIGAVIGGVALPPVSRDTLARYGRAEKKYMHLTFSVIGMPGQGNARERDAVRVFQHPLTETSKPVLTIPTADIPALLHKVRKMNRHRFIKWLQRQPGWPGLDLTGKRM